MPGRVVRDNPNCIIEKYAFEKCPSLCKVKVFAGKIEKGAFSFCRNLESAELSGISEIGDEAFAGCISLVKVSVSASVSEIGKRCFDECISLKNFNFENIRKIGERAFERCDSFQEINFSAAWIGYHAFADCSSLIKISLNSETQLQSGVFFSCTFADTVVLDGISYNFSGFSSSKNSLENKLPLKVQEIVGSVYSCFDVNREEGIVKYRGDALRVKIPGDIVSVEDEAFRDCLRTVDIIFPDSIKYCGKMAFSGTGWIEKKRSEGGYNIINNMIIDAAVCGEKAEIPENVERICSWAFAGNTELKELIISKERITVDVFAFRNCINLKTIKYSDGQVYTLKQISDIDEKNYPQLIRRIFSECINCFKVNDAGILEESTGNIKNLVFPDGVKEIAA